MLNEVSLYPLCFWIQLKKNQKGKDVRTMMMGLKKFDSTSNPFLVYTHYTVGYPFQYLFYIKRVGLKFRISN